MTTRWMQGKRDTMKRQAIKRAEIHNHKLGIHARFAENEKVLSDSWDITPAKPKNVELPPHIEIKRAPCKGVMPHGSYGLVCRKAKGGKVPLWTGTDGRPNNAVAAPAGRGMLRNNWSTNTTPYLIKKA
jgi:hypothetical protein